MSKLNKKTIGITMGDPLGIGPEIIAKAIQKQRFKDKTDFVIIGSASILKKHTKNLPKNCTISNIETPRLIKIKSGKINKTSAAASYQYLEKSVELLHNKKILAVVTAPVSKEGIQRSHKNFIGHTEFFARKFKVQNVGMFFIADQIRTIIVTRHIPLKKVSSSINKTKILETVKLTHQALKSMFKIRNPQIAVCGLNPHAGENGKMGDEETKHIIPAIKMANKLKICASGPFPADTLYAFNSLTKYDAVVAMYHDQGLIPIKTINMNNLVNLTIGLPFIRTSPAHGCAFDIAGKNMADESSMCAAIDLAIALTPKKTE